MIKTDNTAHLAFVLDLMASLRESECFRTLAAVACEQLAAYFDCQKVTLGWRHGQYVKVVAFNEPKKFAPEMEAVRILENALEETVGSEQEITVPGEFKLAVHHQKLAEQTGLRFSLSLPLFANQQAVGALLLQRNSRSFTENEMICARLVAENISDRLFLMWQRERFFLWRFGEWLADKMRHSFGLSNPGQTLGALFFCFFALWFFGSELDRKITAPFIVRSEKNVLVSAPMDAYIKKSYVRVGDRVKSGDLLLELDSSELQIRRQELQAELMHRESEKDLARSEGRLGEMSLAQSRMAKTAAALVHIDHKIETARIKADFSGVVTEDFQQEKPAGTAIRKGDVLMRLHDDSAFYIELEIPEKGVMSVKPGVHGQLVFLGQVDAEYDFSIRRIEPAVILKETRTVFLAEAGLPFTNPPAWLLPGMTGTARLNLEKVSPFRFLLADFLDWWRLRFFW